VSATDGFGGSFTLTVTGDCTTGCTVTLTIDTSMLTTPGDGPHTQDSIDAVAFKLANGSTVGTGLTAPADATWNTPQLTSLNSSGNLCTGMGMDIQVCTAAAAATQFGTETGGTLTWVWTGVMASSPDIAHVGYQYNDGSTLVKGVIKGNIVSCGFDMNGGSVCTSTTPPTVSEPGSLAIMGIGMVGLAALLRRRIAVQT